MLNKTSNNCENLLRYFFKKYKEPAIIILKALNDSYLKPARNFQIRSQLINDRKIKNEEEYNKFLENLIHAGFVDKGDNGIIGITEKGKVLLKENQELHLLTPLYILEKGLKEKLTTLIAITALLASIASIFF